MLKRRSIIIGVILVLFLELFLFNFRFWESLTFQNVKIGEISIGKGIEKIDSNNFRVIAEDEKYIEIEKINRVVKNLYLDSKIINHSRVEDRYLSVSISATDDGNSVYRTFPETNIVKKINASKYVRLYLSGNCGKIRINFNVEEGVEFSIDSLGLNQKRPFHFSLLRVALLFIVWIIFQLFRPSSPIYAILLDYKEKKQCILITTVVLLNILVLLLVGVSIQPHKTVDNEPWNRWPANYEYEALTDALLDGHFYLDIEPSRTIKQMENPYDTMRRAQLLAENSEDEYTDYAYYDGKYYCYFGIVPALLFMVPIKAIFNVQLPDWVFVIMCGVCYCVFAYMLVYSLLKKFFPKATVGIYLFASSIFVSMSSLVYLLHYGNVYSVPIISALMFSVIGLWFWINAEKETIRKSYLVAGAFSIALVFGCRPQIGLVLFFAFPIFWDAIKRKEFFSKKGFGNTLCIIIPCLIVGSFLMYYNYARFGSIFDFGANYNITSNDMTHRGVVLARNWLGIFEYLFQPLNIVSKFPFLQVIGNNLQTDFQGFTSTEPVFGGYIWFNPIIIISLMHAKKYGLKKNDLRGIFTWAFISAIVIILVTIQASGITQRYMSDFGMFLGIVAVCGILIFNEEICMKDCFAKQMRLTLALGTITVFLNYFNLFITGRYYALIYQNPLMYFWVKYSLFTI